MTAVEIIVFALGVLGVLATLGSAIRSVVLPRGIPARLTRRVFLTMRWIFNQRIRRKVSYMDRDRIMALFAPLSLLMLLATWLVCVFASYVAMFWALGDNRLRDALTESGSSITTLGFSRPGDLAGQLLAVSEAAVGLTLLALLITYMPSIYGAFSRREQMVALLEVRAGAPPTAAEMLERFHRIEWLDRLPELWRRWEQWFVDVEETHTSFPALAFFRSPQPMHSWVSAAGAVLDAASFVASTFKHVRDPDAELCIRAGYIGLGRIAAFFRIPYDAAPERGDPISVTRQEYDAMYDRLSSIGIPLRPDRDEAWLDFAGWRVNYDVMLIALARLVMAPETPWVSDERRLTFAG